MSAAVLEINDLLSDRGAMKMADFAEFMKLDPAGSESLGSALTKICSLGASWREAKLEWRGDEWSCWTY